MNIVEENALRKFELMYPRLYSQIVSHIMIAEFETLFTLEDGTKVIFDELTDRCIRLRPRDENSPDLSKEEWRLEFARQLKKKLAVRGISQRELADRLGMTEVTVSKYVNGTQMPDSYTVYRISNIINCPLIELINFNYLLDV